MAANFGTGTIKAVRYCGANYEVRPGERYAQSKQVWTVWRDDQQIKRYVPTRSKAVYYIHEDAVNRQAHLTQVQDGLSYERLVTTVCR